MAKEEASYQQQLLEHIIDKSNLEEYFFLVLKPNLASAALGLHIFTAICCFLILIIILKRRNVSSSPRRDRRGSGTDPNTDPESGLGPGLGTGIGTGIGIGMSSDPVDKSLKSFRELQTQFSSAATGQRKTTTTTTAGQSIMTASQSQMSPQGPQGQVVQPIALNTVRPKGQSGKPNSHLLKQSEMPGAGVGPGGIPYIQQTLFPPTLGPAGQPSPTALTLFGAVPLPPDMRLRCLQEAMEQVALSQTERQQAFQTQQERD